MNKVAIRDQITAATMVMTTKMARSEQGGV